MSSLMIRNVRPLGGAPTDLVIADGRFVDGGPGSAQGPAIDGEGMLALPGLVEAHTHLDKNLIGLPWYRNETGPGRAERIETCRREKTRLGIDPARQSARQVLQTLALGTTHIRSHVDVDTEIGIANVEGVLATRERFRDIVDIEIVAFPQSGMLVRPGTAALMEAALRAGADIVGGIDPGSIDRDPKGHLDAIFAMADRFARPLDIHLHEPGELGAFCLDLIVERTRALGLDGRVLVSHAYCLGALDAARLDPLLSALAQAKIAILTCAPAGHAPALKRLLEAGVVVCAGSDGIRGTWEPWGKGDMLERAARLAQRNGLTRDCDIGLAFEACTSGSARALGLADYGLSPGCKGDLVLVEAETLAEAVAGQPPRRLVVKGGRIVARDGAPVIAQAA
jgi:cytosine/creatinine deaminase